MIVAELSVVPLGTETPSVSRYVATVIGELRRIGLNPEVTAMGTVFESKDIDMILNGLKIAHESVFKSGALRVVSTLKIEERRDKESSIASKVSSVSEKL